MFLWNNSQAELISAAVDIGDQSCLKYDGCLQSLPVCLSELPLAGIEAAL